MEPERMIFVSTKGSGSVYEWQFRDGDYLIFGNESSGLPSAFYRDYQNQLYQIPMPGEHARSHNLANAVSIVLYEALRQVNNWPNGRITVASSVAQASRL
jgi:tRNA (cytidine/uridine-2'-O-)-methyltransferase